MKYLLLEKSSIHKEIKCYPQCKGVPDGFNFTMYDKPNSITNLDNDFFPDFDPEIIVQLEEKAKLTDVVSHTNFPCRGLFINEKLKNILSQYILPEHKFYPGILKYFDNNLNYYWFHLVKKNFYGIDVASSEFRTGFSPADLDNDIYKVNTFDQFLLLQEKLGPNLLWGSKIVLSEIYKNKCFDVLFFPHLHFDIFISEILANRLIKEKISGIEIKEQNFLI